MKRIHYERNVRILTTLIFLIIAIVGIYVWGDFLYSYLKEPISSNELTIDELDGKYVEISNVIPIKTIHTPINGVEEDTSVILLL